MGKTRDLFKKIRDTKGTFHAKKIGDIRKRWQEYTEELYKKDLHHPDNHNGVITHLEPDILDPVLPAAARRLAAPWSSPGAK